MKYEQIFIANNDKYEWAENFSKLFYDDKTILRLNTRINVVGNFNFDKKFSVLLQNNSYFTQLVILKVDEEYYHRGINSTWILFGTIFG